MKNRKLKTRAKKGYEIKLKAYNSKKREENNPND